MKINVDWCHINEGVPGDGKSCPVALALNDQTNWQAHVAGVAISLWDGGDCIVAFPHNPGVHNFIDRFDSGFKGGPFSFDIPQFIL